jgi:hypothetical protein
MFPELPPESEWYRPPQFIRIGMRGDNHMFLWVAEPIKHEVYGVAFRVSESLAFSVCNIDAVYEMLRKAALVELHRRIKCGETLPEGFMLEMATWSPILIRDKKGNISIQEPEPVKLANLYARPGRVIGVNGNPAYMTVQEMEEAVKKSLEGEPDGPEVGPGSGA